MNDIKNKKKQKDLAREIIRDYLKPECDEVLKEEEYPIIKDENE